MPAEGCSDYAKQYEPKTLPKAKRLHRNMHVNLFSANENKSVHDA
jgi:hypothetical protein